MLPRRGEKGALTNLHGELTAAKRHEANGLVDKYAYITNNNVAWGAAIQGLDEPQDFQFGTSTSGFGAAFTFLVRDCRWHSSDGQDAQRSRLPTLQRESDTT